MTDEQVRELFQLLENSPPDPNQTPMVTEHEKFHMILFVGVGYSYRAIARVLHRSHDTVRRYHLAALAPRIIPSPPAPLVPWDGLGKQWLARHYILYQVLEDGTTNSREIALHMHRRNLPFAYEKTQVNDFLVDMKCSSTLPCKRPLLSDDNKANRLRFALQMLNGPFLFFPWIFSDEVRFEAVASRQRIRHVPGSPPTDEHFQDTQQHPGIHVMAWGYIGPWVKGEIQFAQRNVNSEEYVRLVDASWMIPWMNYYYPNGWIFQEDNAPPHRSQFTAAQLNGRCCRLGQGGMPQWPPYSPDANPIENCWAIVKSKVDPTACHTVDDLKAEIRKAWNDIPIATINKLCAGFKNRLRAMVALSGECLNGQFAVKKLVKDPNTNPIQIQQNLRHDTNQIENFRQQSFLFFSQFNAMAAQGLDVLEISARIMNLLPPTTITRTKSHAAEWKQVHAKVPWLSWG
jgi:hypothetical protein